MQSRAPTSARRWLHGDAAADVPRIVCCPHSGGSATYFRPWQEQAPDGIAVLAVQYPGRHERLGEPFARSVHEIADALAAELEADARAGTHTNAGAQPTGLVLFGHSMGASVAFEAARRLARAGVPVAGLIASSHTAPTVPVTSTIHQLPDDAMWDELAAFGGTEPEVLEMAELREVFSPVIRADLTISAEYLEPDAADSIDLPLIGIAGSDDAIAPADEMRDWAKVTTGPFELRTYPGDHFYLDEHAPEILRLAAEMLSAQPGVPA